MEHILKEIVKTFANQIEIKSKTLICRTRDVTLYSQIWNITLKKLWNFTIYYKIIYSYSQNARNRKIDHKSASNIILFTAFICCSCNCGKQNKFVIKRATQVTRPYKYTAYINSINEWMFQYTRFYTACMFLRIPD